MAGKVVAITPPQAIVDNASWTTASIDTKGFDWCDIFIHFGAMDIAMVALKLQHSNTDGSFADVTGADFSSGTLSDGTSAALPSATDDNNFFSFRVDLRNVKRFLDLVATGGDGAVGTFLVAWAVLSRAAESPDTMAERGQTGEIIVAA
ncbi:MAG: hypothetical protein IH945_09475 [Armatimonadetes bacterium]|nr:hypothetical protein [Armatimonadota bacterium]